MSKKQEPIFKCPNDLKINVTKSSGEVVIDEECCTMVSIILKNSGEMASSFFGAHNPEVLRVLEKTIKMYFKEIKKTLKKEFKESPEEEITVLNKDLPEKDKWNGEDVPDTKAENKEKTKETKISKSNKDDKNLKSNNK